MKHRQRRPGRGMPFRKSTERPKSGGGKATLRAFVLLVAVVSVLGSAIAYSIVSGGLSAHDELVVPMEAATRRSAEACTRKFPTCARRTPSH